MKSSGPFKVFTGLTIIIFILLLFHLGSFLNLRIYDLDQNNWFFQMFNFNKEKNVPAIFSGLLHFTASFFLARIAFRKIIIAHPKWFWGVLSFTFLFLGIDELFRIHENIRGNALGNSSGNFLYSWIFFYLGGLILLTVIFLKPLLLLPKRIFWGFLISGFLFVSGAVGMENIVGYIILQKQIPLQIIDVDPLLFFLSSIEELLEMFGVSLFIFYILEFTRRYTIAAPPPEIKMNAKSYICTNKTYT